jgi:thiosulfate/3-mercaptopyruvate sulfurtransferase
MVLTVVVHNPLIPVDQLLQHVTTGAPGQRRPVVLDVTWRLSGPPGRNDFHSAHIPGAVFLDLDADLCGPPGAAGRHPLPDPERLQAALRTAGLRAGDPAVVYDGGDGVAAARAWWTLRWAGHHDVRVLDGGFAAWQAAGGPVTAQVDVPALGDVVVRPGGMPVLDAEQAAELARSGVLLDARTPERFRGETEPIDKVAGHIPGARNLPYGALVAADGRLRADLPEVIEATLAAANPTDGIGALSHLGPDEIGAYCGSGVTAAHTVLALAVAGRPDAPLYVGSWSNWIADPSRPIATGPQEAS